MCTGNCNCSCDQITLAQISGPTGEDGLNAFTQTTAQFTVPAIGANVTLAVSDTSPLTGIWAQANQDIFIQSAGYYRVVSSTATAIVCTNLGVTGNTIPGATVSTTRYVVPAGRSSDVLLNKFDEALYISTPLGVGNYDTLNTNAASIDYTDYAWSTNGDKITTQAAVQLSASASVYQSFRFVLGGTACFTSAVPDKYPPSGRVNFKVEAWRISDTTIQVEATEQVVYPNSTTITYSYYNDVLAISDLDSPGNYTINFNFEVESDVSHTITWQSLNSTK